jgi:ABC-2 type transport system ATP-binding protein
MPAGRRGPPLGDVIEMSHVTRRFGAVTATHDVTFGVTRGETFGLLGHNGAGKTTVLRLVTGLLRAHEGDVRTFGTHPVEQGDEVRRRTGVLTTHAGLDEYLSAAENLAVYGRIHGLDAHHLEQRTRTLMERLGLGSHARTPARALSAGLKQRVALARALIHDPELLLLDEPTANLDPIAARDVRDLIREMTRAGRTVVFTTHNLSEAQALCDRIAVLREGRLLAAGTVDELASDHLSRGITVRIALADVSRAVSALEGLGHGRASVVDGDGRIRVTHLGHDDAPMVIDRLVREGVAVHEAIPHAPSLEDVYMALHDHRSAVR